MTPRVLAGSVGALLAVFLLPQVAAQVGWIDSTDNHQWDDNRNWGALDSSETTVVGPGAKPTDSEDAVFPTPVPGSSNLINLASAETANSLIFHDTYALTGSGTLLLGGDITVDAGVTAGIQVQIIGTATLTKLGAGTLSISNPNNTYSGGTNLMAGTLDIDSPLYLGGTVTTPLGSGTLTINGGTIGTGIGPNTTTAGGFERFTAIANPVVINSNFGVSNVVLDPTISPNSGAAYAVGTHVVNGPYVPGSPFVLSDGVAFIGQITLANLGVTTINTDSGFLGLFGQIVGPSSGGLTFTGNTAVFIGLQGVGTPAGTFGMDLPNTYTGTTTVAGGYVLLAKDVAGSFAIPGDLSISSGAYVQYDGVRVSNQINPSSNVTVDGTLDTSGLNQQVNQLTGTGTVRLDSTAFDGTYGASLSQAGTLTVSSGNFSGQITDAGLGGKLVKTGSGTLTLGGSNTYVGATTVNGGTLVVTGSLAAGSTVDVNSGATVRGTGAILGTLNVNSGGDLQPGLPSLPTTPGTLTVGNLVLNAGSNSDFRLAQPGTIGSGVNDLVSVSGNLTLGGNLNITQLAGFTTGSYTLYTYGGAESGSFSTINGVSSFNAAISTAVAHQVILVVSPISTTQFWDGSGAPNDGIISGGSGTWDNSTSNWTNSTGTSNTTWGGNTAVFAAPGGTVTLGAAISAQGLMFANTGYTITSPSFALTLTGPAAITVTNASDTATIAAPVAGSVGLTLNGSGKLVLTGANTYTGGTTISSGTLQIGNGGTTGVLGSGNVVDNGTLAFNRSDSVAIANNISGTGGLSQIGSGVTFLTGTNTYSGTTTISAGNLEVGFGGTTGTLGTGTVIDNAVLVLFRSDSFTVANTITGSGAVGKDGAGVATLSGVNTYTGGTVVLAGTLQAGSTQAFGVNSAVTVSATLDLAGFNNTIGSLSDGGLTTGIVNNSSASAATLTIGSNNTSTSFGGTIQNSGGGALSLTKVGTGTLTLAGANTYDGTTTVNAGILNIQNGTALGSTAAGTVVSAGATLQLQGGIVTNAEPLTLNGAGAAGQTGALVNVSGGNTFAGPITLGSASTISSDAGQLILNNAAAISGGGNALTLAGAGNGFINDAINTTVASVTKNGGGTWQLGTAGTLNTYTGPTTVNAGVLQAGSVQAFGNNSAVNLTAVGATLDLNGFSNSIGSLNGVAGSIVDNNSPSAATLTTGGSNSNATFNGVIQNSGGGALSLTKNGTGTLTLTGTSTYTGATTVNAGILQVGNGTSGNLTGTSGVTVANNATLVTNLADGTTFSPNVNLNGATATFNAIQSGTNTIAGLLSGTGVFNQNGNGTTILTGMSPGYTGNATVNAGVLEVNGSIANSALTVGSLGTLQGLGSVGHLTNNGTVFPGSTAGGPGTLAVSGNYTQGSGGNLRIGLISASSSGRLAVNGAASLNGAVTAYSVGSFVPQVGNSYQVVSTMGGLSGTFSNVVDQTHSAGTLVKLQASYSSMGATLQFVQGAIPIPAGPGGGGGTSGGSSSSSSGTGPIPGFGGFTGNGIAVAKIINGDLDDPRLRDVLKFLDRLPLSSIPAALDRIAPEELTALATASTSLSNTQIQNIQNRIEALISGISGATAQGMHIAGDGPYYSGAFNGPMLQGPNGKDGKAVQAPPPDNPRLGTFVTGAGEWVNVGNTDSARGYDLVTGEFALGVDYKFTDHLAFGIDAGYAHTGINLENGGHSNIDAGNLGLYGTYFTGTGFYADAAVTGTYNSYENRRAALQGDARGQTDGGALDVLLATGYEIHKGGFTLGATGSFHYTYTGVKDYTEHGSLAPLNFPSQGIDSIRSAFGGRAIYDWHAGGVLIRPEVDLSWQHEYGVTAPGVTARFANGAGGEFTVFGPEIGRDSLLLGAGFAVIWNERLSSYVFYDGEFARTNYDMSSVTGGIRLTF